ncbi:MAG: hypothetical protein WBE80_00935 [Methylocella sp.]
MARYILITSVGGAPPGYQYQRFPRGTTIADTAGNAQPGDVVFPGLAAAPSPRNVAPMDAAAQALMPGSSLMTLAQLASSSIGGP